MIVVFGKSTFQIRCVADVPSAFRFAFDEVDVVHTMIVSRFVLS